MEVSPQPLFGSPTTSAKQAREVAEKLEAAFLAEMLKSSGLGETPSSFGGGSGEDQFASFLREAQAREIVKAGGIGLTQVFEAQFDAGRTNEAT